MTPRSTTENELERTHYWIAISLWLFTGCVALLLGIRGLSGWEPSPFTGLAIFAVLMGLSLFAGWLHRANTADWSIELELINSGSTLFLVILSGLFTLSSSSPVSVLLTLLGVLGTGIWQVYLSGKMEPALVLAEPAKEIEINHSVTIQQETEIPQSEEIPILVESLNGNHIEPQVEERLAEVNLLEEQENQELLDSDTRIIVIPEEIKQLDQSEANSDPCEEEQFQDELEESSCEETDRSYDLFAEQTEWVIQQFRRTRRPSGCEALEGYMKVEWKEGQKSQSIHIPFAPAFSAAPEIYCEPADESDVRLKVAECRSYGVRIELKLSRPALTGETTCLHLLACLEQEEGDCLEELEKSEAELVSSLEKSEKDDSEQGAA
ncbi:MAG: hypothetical protein R3C11_25835 [Planctomycetaceae bacterium]